MRPAGLLREVSTLTCQSRFQGAISRREQLRRNLTKSEELSRRPIPLCALKRTQGGARSPARTATTSLLSTVCRKVPQTRGAVKNEAV